MYPHLSTYLTRSPARLLEKISLLGKRYGGHDLTLLFALSANFADSQDLRRAADRLVKFERTRIVGCLSGGLGCTRINGQNVRHDIVSLSVVVFDSANVIPFRSTIPGREEAQVGRWHAFRRKGESVNKEDSLEEGVSWGDVWEGGGKPVALPEELRSVGPEQIQSIVYFSDLKPEGLLSSFHHLPGVTKLGLLASSTPFITGRPVTLFHNQKIFPSGAVGLAITGGGTSPNTKPAFEVDFLDVRRLGDPMTITQCEGNMVNTLDGNNPTQLLISAIKKEGLDTHVSGSFKEEEQFSIAALREDGKIDRVYRITAGDPSRGSLSIDSPTTPRLGTRVQFIHRPSIAIPHLTIPIHNKGGKHLSVLTTSDELHYLHSQQQPPLGVEEPSWKPDIPELETWVAPDIFLAASENGFVFERGECPGENVKCSLPGSLGTVSS